jgi:hypothetical protein
MKPVDQTIFGHPNGDCFRACVASILELPIEDVPNWAAEGRGVVHAAMDWIHNRGHACLNIQWEPEYEKHQYLSTGMERVYCILGGVSPRSTPESRLYHAVVGHAAGWSFEIDHDPHPSRAGIVGEPINAVWIFRGIP